MSSLVTGDRSATRAEVLAARKVLRQLASQHGLSRPRVDVTGTVVVHSEEPGYSAVRRYATAAAGQLGVWVNVITDDASAAQVDTETL
jgi:ABC-type sugar transport system substrate-binding protein